MTSKKSFEVEKFISEIEKFPELYNKIFKKYGDRNFKKKFEKFVPNYNEMDDKTKNDEGK